jgi:hypothetical protein
MATNFPGSVDNFANPTSANGLDSPSHADQHANANDAIEAVETYVLNSVYSKTNSDNTFATKSDFPADAWTAYTPTFGNLTVGNGTINAAYKQLGKTVHVRISFTWGSTTSGTGSPTTVSIPITTKSDANLYGCGNAYAENAGITGYVLPILLEPANNRFYIGYITSNSVVGAYVNNAQPFTWGTGDFFKCIFTYEAA